MSAPTTQRLSLAPQNNRRRNLISLTPLIDVVFILLVFFMLASSFLDWRSITLDPPKQTGGSPSLEQAVLIASVLRNFPHCKAIESLSLRRWS